MNKKIFLIQTILIVCIVSQYQFLTWEYVKIGNHDYQLNEEYLQPYEYEKFLTNEYEKGKIINFSGEIIQILNNKNSVLFSITQLWNDNYLDEYDYFGGGNYLFLTMDIFTQEQLIEKIPRNKIIYFKNLEYIGTIEVKTLTGFKEKRPVFTFTNETEYYITYYEQNK